MEIESVSTMGSGSIGREIDTWKVIEAIKEEIGEINETFHNQSMATFDFCSGQSITIYRTGSFQIRGATDIDKLQNVEGCFKEVLNDIGLRISDYEFSIKNVVFKYDLDKNLNLELLAVAIGFDKTEYEPEQFPALIYRPDEYSTTLLVFSTGKTIITGITDEEKAEEIIILLKQKVGQVESTTED